MTGNHHSNEADLTSTRPIAQGLPSACGLGLLTSVGRYLRRGDVRGLLRAAAERRPPGVFNHAVFYVFELGMERAQQAISSKDTLPEGFEFRSATLDDVLRDTELAPRERSEYERRFAAGDHCYAVFDGSNCVNLNWIHFGSCYVRGAGLLLELTGRDGYVYGVVTRPSHRGLGLYTAAQARLVDLLVRDRISRFLQLVEATNMAPLKVLPRLGYERTQAVRSMTALGGKLTLIQQLATMTTFQQHHWRSPSQVFRI